MRRIGLYVLALALLLTVGCESTPREQFADAQDTYISTVTVLLEAREAGFFTQEEWAEDVLPAINTGDEVLDVLDAATSAGVPAEDSRQQLAVVLRQLRPLVLEYLAQQE